ncbi:DgyrCDS6136 [Dimorphilus gyrociliatus]|uniref:Proline iminopeptidase n=1 Tax=Dimorphilus gyrociliatus TaxID=2664684 RepID=A0A7I8VPZ0_9ANNE|nr:DgyrCDS6136 [Dimorphilus gyrociliatus]
MSTKTELYGEITPFNDGFLKVSEIHSVYYEESGNPKGNPVIFLHGGPGGGTSPRDRRYFDPAVYRIVLMDQRGAGKSKPAAELRENTPKHLISDIETLRNHLGIDKWVVFGGSWGSTLSLLYAEAHPDRVKALILRGIFTLRRKEILWLYQEGASFVYPDHYEEYISVIPEVERHDLVSAYYRRLTGPDKEERLKCARAWSKWELATSRLFIDEELLSKVDNDEWALQFARIECTYFVKGGFFDTENQIFDNAYKIKHIPTTIVQGRYDMVCPMISAWELHKQLPNAEFFIIPDSGHSTKEVGTYRKLVETAEKYKNL